VARRDWRWWVGGIGRTLIITGLLLFAFVGYQLWGTAIEESQAQNHLESEFEDLLAGTTTTSTVTTSTAAPSSSTTLPAVTTTTEPGGVQELPPINDGDPIAALDLPTIGVSKYVVAGIGVDDLKKGPGHFPSTPLPGQYGNAAIAGHRTTYGAPFYDIDELEVGDPIVVTTLFGTYTYRVTEQLIVSAEDYALVVDGDPTKATLTLVSCHPRYTAKQRIVVRSELDPYSSDEPGRAVLNYGRDEPAPEAALPGEATPADTATGATTPDDSAPDSSTTTSTVAAALDDGTHVESSDAFAQGWFDDAAAWPHVIGWGLVLVAISVGGVWVSRRTHRRWLGVLVAAVPFVICLYFWFQNINRLLPPNL
jgi:sortase A